MSEDDHGERIRAVEVQVQSIEKRMDRFEQFCKQTQRMYRESFADMNTRIENFLNHEVHELKDQIADAKNTKRAPLSWSDWTKIIVAIITIAGVLITTFR